MPCTFAYPRHNDVSDIIRLPPDDPLLPNTLVWIELPGQRQRAAQHLGCCGRRRANHGSYDGFHPGDHQVTKVLLPSGFCSANVSVPHKALLHTHGADTLMAFCSSKADHHTSVCCTGERSTARVTPDCQLTPEIPLAVSTSTSPIKPKTQSGV